MVSMIIIEEFSNAEAKLCVGGAAIHTLIPLAALLVYSLVVHLLIVKQQFYLHLEYTFDIIRNGALCAARPWLLCCGNILAAMEGWLLTVVAETVRTFVTLPIKIMRTMMPAANHIRIVPSDWDTDTHATEPANNDTTIKSSDPMLQNSLTVVKKSNFDQLFCFNAGCLLSVCAIGMVRTFVILLINLCFKIIITIMPDDIGVFSGELDKSRHCVLSTTNKSKLVSGYTKTVSITSNTSQLLTPKGTIPVMTRDDKEVSKPHSVENSFTATVCNYAGSYLKLLYPVLVGNTVRICNTKLYASLPQKDKYMVEQRVQDASGATKIKLVLHSSNESSMKEPVHSLPQAHVPDNDDVETDGNNRKTHYRGNTKKAGYIVYTCDGSFRGDIKYPLPNGKATNSKIGKGGNGFVFIIYHGKKQYAVKQTVYRPNEINVHSSLNHVNILPLLAVLMGEKHKTHAGRSYCYHFMPKMDYDLRQILSTKEVGCLKYLYRNCSTNRTRFDRAFGNVKFILKETLKALSYIHSNGYVHRDVKASNIMIKMNCQCNPLYCDCSFKFKVKLGDFDSAGTIPGIKEPTDQMIKFASILPLGTPGYRAPEVSMHVTLSGPYETLYTTAVDMWSFGCLCLNICIGKTAALKQREEASLLLSTTNHCFEELWIKTTKIHELEKTQPFSNDTMLLHLIQSCLKVDCKKRLSAMDAQAYL